jgi:hypothetical protein
MFARQVLRPARTLHQVCDCYSWTPDDKSMSEFVDFADQTTASPPIRVRSTPERRQQCSSLYWHRCRWSHRCILLSKRRPHSNRPGRQCAAIRGGEEDPRTVRRVREEGLHWWRAGLCLPAAGEVRNREPQHQEAYFQAAGAGYGERPTCCLYVQNTLWAPTHAN